MSQNTCESQGLRDRSKLAGTISKPLAQSQQSEETNESAGLAFSRTGWCGQITFVYLSLPHACSRMRSQGNEPCQAAIRLLSMWSVSSGKRTNYPEERRFPFTDCNPRMLPIASCIDVLMYWSYCLFIGQRW